MSISTGHVPTGFVRKRLIAALAVIGALAAGAWFQVNSIQSEANQQLLDRTMSNLLSNLTTSTKLDEAYQDADGDLVADAPTDAAQLESPEAIVFSFLAVEDGVNQQEVWKGAMDAVSKRIGIPVTYLRLTDSKQQLEAFKNGSLHVTAFGSGGVPGAVNGAGFVPICTFGHAKDGFGYHMKFIVRADSDIKNLAGLRDHSLGFTRPRSNSGFKAALVLLMEEHDLRPERDYKWSYTFGHPQSIVALKNGEIDAAPVAGDVLKRLVAKGEIKESDYRVLYESERFPPAAFGYSHNLAPEIQQGIREALLELDWKGTELPEQFGYANYATFAPVSYKDDWANIRRVDQALSSAQASWQKSR